MFPLTSVNDLRDVLEISQEQAEEVANAIINLVLSADCLMFGGISIDLEELYDEEKTQRMSDEEKDAASYLFAVLKSVGYVGLHYVPANIVVIAKPQIRDVIDAILGAKNGSVAQRLIDEEKLASISMVQFTRGVVQIMQKQLLLSSVAKKSKKET